MPLQVALHAARLAFVEAALSAPLREMQTGTPFDGPDSVVATLGADGGLDLQFLRGNVPVGGEGL